MKSIKKLLSIFLIFILCVAVSFGSSACDLSHRDTDIIEYDESEYLDDTADDVGFPNNVSFYKYLNIFNNAQTSGKLYVNSVEMLAAYIEYVNFYTITKKVNITITYSADSFDSEYEAAKELYENGEFMAIGYEASIGYSGKTGSYRITKSDADTLATKTFDEDKEYVWAQTDYALKMVAPNTRDADYDDFALNSRTKVLTNITNSEQLRWAISNGYKPQCVEGSPAEKVLNSAKAVLREIVSDEMDDITKLRAIYEWLALNVQYDNLAAQELQANAALKASEYDAWYAEGVFDNLKAVCEGYAKALIIMAGLEGIPAIFITGDGHAWNRVMIDGEWYVVDATHADVHANLTQKEVFSYGSFMITDAEKTDRGYTSEQYADLPATTEFNIFENLTFTYNEHDYDLVIESASELKAVLEYAKSLNPIIGENGCTVDVFVKQEDDMGFNFWKELLYIQPLYETWLKSETDLNGNAHYTFYLK